MHYASSDILPTLDEECQLEKNFLNTRAHIDVDANNESRVKKLFHYDIDHLLVHLISQEKNKIRKKVNHLLTML